MDLGFQKTKTVNLKEKLVRTTLHSVRSQGHPYLELREDGKKLIFFCTLCLAPCYSDSVLFNHLNGNLHATRLATARVTLLKPNPWPLNDGVFFFHDVSEAQNNKSQGSEPVEIKLLDTQPADENGLSIVRYGENLGPNATIPDSNEIPSDCDVGGHGPIQELVIPEVLQKNVLSDLVVRHMGVGRIGARFSEKDGISDKIHRIWCEWLGDQEFDDEDIDVVPEHEFAIVIFSYNYNLGRKDLFDGFKYLLPSSSPHSEAEDSGCSRGKKRKSFSDPEDISEASRNQYDSDGEDSQSSNNSNSKVLVAGNDDQMVYSRILSSKTMRKELRKQQRVASERSCDICQQKMLPNKDVAALLNRKAGKLVCSSRNFTGAFHVFHVSCLLHWIMLCEVEIFASQSAAPKAKQKSRRKLKSKDSKTRKKCEMEEASKQICSAFCPECQGTGVRNDEELEKPSVSLSEIFRHKIQICDARKAWMKSPEILRHCSMGFTFPMTSDELYQENMASLKLLNFYRAVS